MAKFDVNEEYDLQIDKFEKTDPVHADLFNSKFIKLIRSIAFVKKKTDTIPSAVSVKGAAESSYRTGEVNISPKDIGLGRVNNTADAEKPVSKEQQEAIDNAIHALNTDLVDRVYPVGSIYISVISTDPGELFGGTWEVWGTGCVPVGVDESGTNFNIAEKTGGSASISYTPGGSISGTAISIDQMPQHNHSVDVTTAETDISHTHDISGLTGSASSNGAHTHSVTQTFTRTGASGTNKAIIAASATETTTNGTANVNGDHGHSVTINNSKTQGGGGKHKHTISGSTKSTGGSKEHSHNFEGIEATISTLQPYITCYMWKRTA